MIRQLGKRIFEFSIVLFMGITIIFLLVHLAPGDPSTRFLSTDFNPEQQVIIKERLGLDQPLFRQYLHWLEAIWQRFDLGYSFMSGLPVKQQVATALCPTLLLVGCALTIGIMVGIFSAIPAALHQGRRLDRWITSFMLVCYSTPSFWLGLMLLQIFTIHLHWLPPSQMVSLFHSQLTVMGKILDFARHMVLPVTALSVIIAAGFYRYMRQALLEALNSPYVAAAQARGLPQRTVIFNYALPNTLLPLISLIGTHFPYLFSGALVIEVVFGLPGIGRLLADSAASRDYPVILATTTMGFVATLIGNLIADLLYLVVDPRLRTKR